MEGFQIVIALLALGLFGFAIYKVMSAKDDIEFRDGRPSGDGGEGDGRGVDDSDRFEN